MNNRKMLLSLALGLSLGASAFASIPSMLSSIVLTQPMGGGEGQRPPRGGMRRPQGVGILMMRQVQEELNLSDAQNEKIRAILEANRPAQGNDGPPRGAPNDAERQRGEKVRKEIAAVLNESQNRRLDQLMLQADGPRALLRPEVGDKLKLSNAQRDEIRDFMESTRPQPGTPPPAPDEMRAKVEAMLKRVLSAAQQSEWAKMLGKPFDFGPPPGGGRGPGGPGGPGGGGDGRGL